MEVKLERDKDEIRIMIADTGAGFKPASFMNIDPKRATHSHGRGVALANLISFSSIEYQGCGNEVIACVKLEK